MLTIDLDGEPIQPVRKEGGREGGREGGVREIAPIEVQDCSTHPVTSSSLPPSLLQHVHTRWRRTVSLSCSWYGLIDAHTPLPPSLPPFLPLFLQHVHTGWRRTVAFACSWYGLIDLLSILPFWVNFFFIPRM